MEPASRSRLDDETQDRVVEMYRAGVKVDDITEETGVKRPSIYYTLRKRGLRPTRTARGVAGPSTSELFVQVAAKERALGRAEARIETLAGLLARAVDAVDDPLRADAIRSAAELSGVALPSAALA